MSSARPVFATPKNALLVPASVIARALSLVAIFLVTTDASASQVQPNWPEPVYQRAKELGVELPTFRWSGTAWGYFERLRDLEFADMVIGYDGHHEKLYPTQETEHGKVLELYRDASNALIGFDWAPDPNSLRIKAWQVISSGISDPMATYLYGYYSQGLFHDDSATPYLRDAAERMSESDHSSLAKARAWFALADHLFYHEEDQEAEQAIRRAAEFYVQAAREVDPQDVFRARVIVNRIAASIADKGTTGSSFGAAIIPLFDDARGIDPWISECSRGFHELNLGWRARGEGFANTVTDEGWRLFDLHLKNAREHFNRASVLHIDRPEPASGMARVITANKGFELDDHQFWANWALDADPSYTGPLYEKLWSLRPRWGGSHAEMLEFGRWCAANTPVNTRGPLVLIEAVRSVAEEQASASQVLRNRQLYEECRDVLLRCLEHPAHQSQDAELRSLLVLYAYIAGDLQLAADQMRRISPRDFDRDAIWRYGMLYENLRDAVYMNSALQPDAFEALTEAARLSQWDTVLEIIRSARQGLKSRDHAPEILLLEHADAIYTFFQALDTGWAPLPFQDSDTSSAHWPGWIPRSGRWSAWVDEAGHFMARCAFPRGHFMMLHRVPLTDGYEVRFTLHISRRTDALAGLVFGFKTNIETTRWMSVYYSGPGRRLYLGERAELNGQRSDPIDIEDGTIEIRVAVLGQRVMVAADGRPVFDGEYLNDFHPASASGMFGFGGYSRSGSSYVLFSDAAIRRITEPPEWTTKDTEE